MSLDEKRRPTIRVILAAHGEAETAGFLENFLVGWRTLGHAAEVMRLSAPLRLAICTMHGLRKRLTRQSGSPHNANTRNQAKALELSLASQNGAQFIVDSAFASASPSLNDQIDKASEFDQQVVVSLIPSDSRLSCGLFCHALLEAPKHLQQNNVVLSRLWESSELIDIHCAHIEARCPPVESGGPSCLLLVLHGTLVRDQQGQKPHFHTGEAEKTFYGQALRAALMSQPEKRWDRIEIAFLNHGVGGQWSAPTLDETLSRLEKEGVNHLVAYACEHLVDGSETAQLAARLNQSAIAQTHCLPSLNSDPDLIDFLAKRLQSALQQPRTAMCCDPCPLVTDSAATV
ncbi:MAG: ferrochelatase [Wenzhouxiangella sp.]|nr:ferrochelatase [Wenzhouxiangella sp.]